ncbi:hypothetical protein B5F74_11265 [Collinsella sp. An271]|uniref:DegT/DnrJ/EryC1/StrS family aminotransferase n=1 Tax=Collinsella sp. An271 TaxID=1965616 RepID=UPI000B3AC546|nr:DegT/DnrJ/EryC1/StrS family aminotransferase [Collinsella sp. An271]OUO57986.1 hypothetical protein B5F74_11265 [Collinsella sp. An271]
MEFRDLGAQYRALRDAIDSAVSRVLASGRYIGGEEVSALESKLAGYVGSKHCIACANGADALRLALMAWGARNRLSEWGIPTSVYCLRLMHERPAFVGPLAHAAAPGYRAPVPPCAEPANGAASHTRGAKYVRDALRRAVL